MNNRRRLQHPEPGPLPAEIPPQLHSVDMQLQREARRLRVPQGLTSRVFDASVGLLPVRARTPQIEVLATISNIGSGLNSSYASIWGRIAMAASLGLVAMIAFDVSRSPTLPQLVAGIDSELAPYYQGVVGKTISDMDYLLVTRDVTYDDLDMEFAILAADLDM